MARGKGSYETKIKISGELLPSFEKSLQTASAELKGLYHQAKRENTGFMAGVDGLDKLADQTFSLVGKAAKVTAAGVAGIVSASTMVGASYEEQMSTVRSISNASTADMQRLDKLAQEMGRTTKFSAKEAGEGLEYMAMAGWKTDQMLSGLPGILDLAAASGEELGAVSDIVTDALTAFKLQAEDAGEFSDVLAATAANANTNVSMMGETFKTAAPVAGALGYTIQDTALATGLMANAGIKAGDAGTAMRSLFTNMAKPTKSMRTYMERLNISLTDSSGNMKTFREQLESIRTGFSGLTDAQKAEYAAGIAGKYGMSGLLAIVNANEKDFSKLADAIDNSTGAAERMADLRIDNLAGDFTLLKSAAEGAGIGIYGVMNDVMREIIQGTSALINEFTESDFLKSLTKGMPSARREIKQFGKEAGTFLEPILGAGKWFLKHPDVIVGSITGIGSALLTFKAAKGITNVVKAFGSLAGMSAAWPVAATGIAIGGIIGISTAIHTAEQEAARANLAAHFGEIALSIDELDEAARNVFGDGFLGNIDAFREAGKQSESLKKNLEESLGQIKKENWKVSIGIAFDEEDEASYQAMVDDYVKQAQDYISGRGYELQLAIGLVFGDSESGMIQQENSGQFYKAMDDEVKALSTQLTEVLNTELSESFTIQDKHAKAAQLLNDIAEITDIVAASQNKAKLQVIGDKYRGTDLLDSETFQNLQQEVAEYSKTATESVETAYEQVLAGLESQRQAGELGKAGGISQEEYDTGRLDALRAYDEQRAQVILDGYNLTKETIAKTYGIDSGLMDEAGRLFQEKLPEIMKNVKPNQDPKMFTASLWQGWSEAFDQVMGEEGIDEKTQKAIGKLMEGLDPIQEQMSEYADQMKASGQEIPKGILDGMADAEALEAIGGSVDGIWAMIGREAAENPEAVAVVQKMQEDGKNIPDVFAKAIRDNLRPVEDSATEVLQAAKTSLEKGIAVAIPVTATLNVSSQSGQKPEEHASGGLMTKPTLSYFAENSPEMAIPIDGSKRAISLWEETGHLLGVYRQNNYEKAYEQMEQSGTAKETNSQVIAPVYAPVQNFYGNTSKEEVEAAGMTKYEQFREWIERYQYERARASF